MRTFRIAMAQMNPTVGDLDGNVRRITAWLRRQESEGRLGRIPGAGDHRLSAWKIFC